MTEARPAFYALAPGGWRDYVTLVHPPYTLWHLSYVVIGAALAPHFHAGLLCWTLLAFFSAMGIGAHALDELRGRPLQTLIPARTLVALAFTSILWLLLFVAVGAGLVVAYNLELFGGRLHGDPWFSLGWGAFPVLTAYFASAHTLRSPALLAALFAALLSRAQRVLSTPVRDIRRRTRSVSGQIERTDGSVIPLDAQSIAGAPERALQTLSVTVIALALALVLLRVT